ncbi:hypothetical protein U2H75_005333 [Escherichia coli]|nr:hypothetical protein [Escherichia coli]
MEKYGLPINHEKRNRLIIMPRTTNKPDTAPVKTKNMWFLLARLRTPRGLIRRAGVISRQHDEQADQSDTTSRRYYDFRNAFAKT